MTHTPLHRCVARSTNPTARPPNAINVLIPIGGFFRKCDKIFCGAIIFGIGVAPWIPSQDFSENDFSDGMQPSSGVVAAPSTSGIGSLYGSTFYGGYNCGGAGTGCGTVYELSTDGTLTTLYQFQDSSDGSGPNQVILGKGDNLFGTTGGPNGVGGTIFELTTSALAQKTQRHQR